MFKNIQPLQSVAALFQQTPQQTQPELISKIETSKVPVVQLAVQAQAQPAAVTPAVPTQKPAAQPLKQVTPSLFPATKESDMTRRQLKQQLIEKNSKTIFLGNVPSDIINHPKKLKKQFVQYGPIVAIRFRSIAFSKALPRKVAFITKALHEKRNTVNAYIEFETSESAQNALAFDGQLFEGNHLRIDLTEKNHSKEQLDSKASVFIGNLPFDAHDEALWKLFDGLDIHHVRIIRDRKTNVGKGFAYVQFNEKSNVELAIKLNGALVSNRPVRISRSVDQLSKKGAEGVRASRNDQVVLKTTKDSRHGVRKGGGPQPLPTGAPRVKKPRHVPRITEDANGVPIVKIVEGVAAPRVKKPRHVPRPGATANPNTVLTQVPQRTASPRVIAASQVVRTGAAAASFQRMANRSAPLDKKPSAAPQRVKKPRHVPRTGSDTNSIPKVTTALVKSGGEKIKKAHHDKARDPLHSVTDKKLRTSKKSKNA